MQPQRISETGFYKDMQFTGQFCRRRFTEGSKYRYARHKFPKKTILLSVMLYRYGLSSYESQIS